MRTPHDELFRRAFGRAERARELLRVALPGEISARLDLEAVRIKPGSYVDRRLRSAQSDLLLETRSRGRKPVLVYVLVEHKSSLDRRVLFQLLRYMVGIWEGWISTKENENWKQLPPIIPVIFSHAAQRWRYPLEFSALVREPLGLELRRLTPSFSAVLLDLADRQGEGLGADRLVSALLRLYRDIRVRSSRELESVLAEIADRATAQGDPELLQAVLTYLLRARQGRSVRSILEAVPKGEMRGETMTIAESLERKGRRKGRAEGKLEGKLEGRLEEKQEVLVRLVERKFKLTERERKSMRSHTNADELDAAIDAIVSARSKGEVLSHLS